MIWKVSKTNFPKRIWEVLVQSFQNNRPINIKNQKDLYFSTIILKYKSFVLNFSGT